MRSDSWEGWGEGGGSRDTADTAVQQDTGVHGLKLKFDWKPVESLWDRCDVSGRRGSGNESVRVLNPFMDGCEKDKEGRKGRRDKDVCFP